MSHLQRAGWRWLIILLLSIAPSVPGSPDVASAVQAAYNPIVVENQQPGTDAWYIWKYPKIADDTSQQIKGYASAVSVNKGQGITVYVSVNPAQTYMMDIYRIGCYGGAGGRLMQHMDPLPGVRQPACPVDRTTGLIACNWTPGFTLTVPMTWTSGVYLVLLTNARTYRNYIQFVVRDDARQAALLYQRSVTTDQAYNNYPDDKATGKSLYDYNSYGANTVAGSRRAVKVSFDRPYADIGSGNFLNWEVDAVKWLEQQGYDVSYSTDLDTHTNGSRLLDYRAFLAVGHDEYWSNEMYNAVQNARDAGVDLAFLGSNAVYWQIRFESSASGVANRVEVCYKNVQLDPLYNINNTLVTVRWRDAPVNRPEQTLLGAMYTSITDSDNLYAYVVKNSSHWIYTRTGLKDGDSIPNIVGYEADQQQASYPLPSTIGGAYVLLSNSPYPNDSNQTDYQNTTIYQTPRGA